MKKSAEASRIRRPVADVAEQVTMDRKREKVIRTREEKVACDSDRVLARTRRQKEKHEDIEDTPAVPNKPTDHAVTGGRDVSLRHEGGHSPENHTVVLEWYWKPAARNFSQPAEHVVAKLHDEGARAPTASQRSRRAQC